MTFGFVTVNPHHASAKRYSPLPSKPELTPNPPKNSLTLELIRLVLLARCQRSFVRHLPVKSKIIESSISYRKTTYFLFCNFRQVPTSCIQARQFPDTNWVLPCGPKKGVVMHKQSNVCHIETVMAKDLATASAPGANIENPEHALIARILDGETRVFHELIRPYERSVYLTSFSVLGNHADAEESVQDTMIKAFKHLHQLNSIEKFKPWLLKIAVNQARQKRRGFHEHFFESLENEGNSEATVVSKDFADWRPNPLELLQRKQVREKVSEVLQGLPEIYREIFIMRDMQHLSVEECSQLLETSKQVVKVRLHRARLMLKERLEPVFKKALA